MFRLGIEMIERICGRAPGGLDDRSTKRQHEAANMSSSAVFFTTVTSLNDELPYWVDVGAARHLVIPYSFETNDNRFDQNHGFSNGDDFARYMIDCFETMYAEGAERPKLMSLALHDRLIGRPGRVDRAHQVSRSRRRARPRLDLYGPGNRRALASGSSRGHVKVWSRGTTSHFRRAARVAFWSNLAIPQTQQEFAIRRQAGRWRFVGFTHAVGSGPGHRAEILRQIVGDREPRIDPGLLTQAKVLVETVRPLTLNERETGSPALPVLLGGGLSGRRRGGDGPPPDALSVRPSGASGYGFDRRDASTGSVVDRHGRCPSGPRTNPGTERCWPSTVLGWRKPADLCPRRR